MREDLLHGASQERSRARPNTSPERPRPAGPSTLRVAQTLRSCQTWTGNEIPRLKWTHYLRIINISPQGRWSIAKTSLTTPTSEPVRRPKSCPTAEFGRRSRSRLGVARAWIRLVLDLTAGRVSLTLNGPLIDDGKRDPLNQHSFGLFQFAGET